MLGIRSIRCARAASGHAAAATISPHGAPAPPSGEDYTYHIIETETGASTATISRVKRCLNYGNDAYGMALERVKKGQAPEEETEEKE